MTFVGVFYISTYEGVRHILSHQNIDSKIRALVAGGLASVVGQTIIVPFDVVSQHLMMLGSQKVKIKIKYLLNTPNHCDDFVF